MQLKKQCLVPMKSNQNITVVTFFMTIVLLSCAENSPQHLPVPPPKPAEPPEPAEPEGAERPQHFPLSKPAR